MNKNRKYKGESGYINYKKKRELLVGLLIFAIAAGIFILGLALNKWEKSNVFTIIAVLVFLPAARRFVGFILFFPYHSISTEQYTRVKSAVKSGNRMYADMVITSTQKVMNLAYMVITGDKILILAGREKEKEKLIEEYIAAAVKRRGYDYKVTAVKEEKQFLSLLTKTDSAADMRFEDDEDKQAYDHDREELLAFLESLMA